MKRMTLGLLAAAFAACLAAPGAWAGGAHETGKETIVVGSKIDTEGGLLGQMIILMLQANGFTAVNKTQLGPTDVVREAITSGEIDIYPEYTGNGAFFFPGTDPSIWKDPEASYETVKKLDLEKNRIVWLTPAPADNTWAIAVRKDLATTDHLATLSNLASYIDGGGKFKLAASDEFVSRPDVLPAFEKTYGFTVRKSQLLVVSSGDTAQTEKAAADATDGVDAAMAYGTDGQLAALGLTVLNDDKHVEPVYEPAPIIREAVYQKHPEIGNLLAPVFKSLTREVLQELNSRIAIQGEEPATVAKTYLTEHGFLK